MNQQRRPTKETQDQVGHARNTTALHGSEMVVNRALLASAGVSAHPDQIASRGTSTEEIVNAAVEAARPERHVS